VDRPGTSRCPRPILGYHAPTTCAYNSHSNFPSQGIELVCSVANCGTDQTDRWYGSKIETNKPVRRKCYTLQSVVPDRVCGAGCGKGVSDVTKWYHSQRDKNNKDLWFCKSCYDKEVRTPNSPRIFHPEPFRLTRVVRFFYFSQVLQLAKEAGRTCVSCLAAETTSWHTCDGVPDGWDCALCFNKRDSSKSYKKEYNKEYNKDEKAEERLSVDGPNPLFSFLETPHDPEPRRNLIRDEVRRNKMVK
jgi:hypothetical protein